jgi:muconolactone delta-isomerase
MKDNHVKKQKPAALISGVAVILLLSFALPMPAQYKIYDLGVSSWTQDLTADAANRVHITWTNYGVLYYGEIVNNALSGVVQVARGVNTVYWRPYISVQPDGSSVHIAWTTAGMGNMLMHSWRTSGEWKTETILSVPDSQWLCQPTCAIDSSGVTHVMFVIWNDVRTSQWSTIFYMRKLANGTWEDKVQFAPKSPEYKHPGLFVDVLGQVHASWTILGRSGSDSYDAYYGMAPSGGKLYFDTGVKLPKAEDCNVNSYGDLYVDRYGNVHRSIGGWSNAEQKMCIDHTRKPVGGSFLAPTRPSLGFLNLKGGDPVPVVVAREDGRTVVAWGEIGADGNAVKASFFDPDLNAWVVNTIDPAAGIPTQPNAYRVAMTRTDTHVFGAWRGGNEHLKLFVMPIDANIRKDFNRDGKVDILWRNTGSGANRAWYMDKSKQLGEGQLPAATNLNLKIGGTGDFNGDGKVDILWRNIATGANLVWTMDGIRRLTIVSLPALTDKNMTIAGTGDFNRDGKMDILWRNTATGSNTVWYMDGVTLLGEGLLPANANTKWKIAGTGDFNRDGKVDIVWRDTGSGANWVWYMDNLTRIGGAKLPAVVNLNWEIAGIVDLNGDWKVDILWRDYGSGANWVWYMDNAKQLSGARLPVETDLTWRIENQ